MRPSQARRHVYVMGPPHWTYRGRLLLAVAWGVFVMGALLVVAAGAGLGAVARGGGVLMRASDMERVCAVAFRRWCAENLIDPRLEDILEEAFINGFIARDAVEIAGTEMHKVAVGTSAGGASSG